ncbi:MAG: hypothetical protein WCD81_07175 [Candidatus Bathyarchaeia archaeon]
MSDWVRQLRFNPIPILIKSENKAISYFAGRDLLEQPAEPVYALWRLPEVTELLDKQKINGSWKYHGGKEAIRSQENYDQLETYRTLGILVEKYGFTSEHLPYRKPPISSSAFKLQKETSEESTQTSTLPTTQRR